VSKIQDGALLAPSAARQTERDETEGEHTRTDAGLSAGTPETTAAVVFARAFGDGAGFAGRSGLVAGSAGPAVAADRLLVATIAAVSDGFTLVTGVAGVLATHAGPKRTTLPDIVTGFQVCRVRPGARGHELNGAECQTEGEGTEAYHV
jgi:hypothetical protein